MAINDLITLAWAIQYNLGDNMSFVQMKTLLFRVIVSSKKLKSKEAKMITDSISDYLILCEKRLDELANAQS